MNEPPVIQGPATGASAHRAPPSSSTPEAISTELRTALGAMVASGTVPWRGVGGEQVGAQPPDGQDGRRDVDAGRLDLPERGAAGGGQDEDPQGGEDGGVDGHLGPAPGTEGGDGPPARAPHGGQPALVAVDEQRDGDEDPGELADGDGGEEGAQGDRTPRPRSATTVPRATKNAVPSTRTRRQNRSPAMSRRRATSSTWKSAAATMKTPDLEAAEGARAPRGRAPATHGSDAAARASRPALQAGTDPAVLAVEDGERVTDEAVGEGRHQDDHAEAQREDAEPSRAEQVGRDDLEGEAAGCLPEGGEDGRRRRGELESPRSRPVSTVAAVGHEVTTAPE